jgi:hypothetical protein
MLFCPTKTTQPELLALAGLVVCAVDNFSTELQLVSGTIQMYKLAR